VAYWFLKSEPTAYGFESLQQDGRAVWDGIRNAQALIHIRAMKRGDQALFYHTGAEKAVVGTVRIDSAPYADPAAGDPKLAVVDIVPDRALRRPVTLAELKSDPAFQTLGLVRHSRLSVGPVTAEQWKRILRLAGGS
jgi:predicted RNA-binding protein with PUA-like domain